MRSKGLFRIDSLVAGLVTFGRNYFCIFCTGPGIWPARTGPSSVQSWNAKIAHHIINYRGRHGPSFGAMRDDKAACCFRRRKPSNSSNVLQDRWNYNDMDSKIAPSRAPVKASWTLANRIEQIGGSVLINVRINKIQSASIRQLQDLGLLVRLGYPWQFCMFCCGLAQSNTSSDTQQSRYKYSCTSFSDKDHSFSSSS